MPVHAPLPQRLPGQGQLTAVPGLAPHTKVSHRYIVADKKLCSGLLQSAPPLQPEQALGRLTQTAACTVQCPTSQHMHTSQTPVGSLQPAVGSRSPQIAEAACQQLQQRIQGLEEELSCPVTLQPMEDPVLLVASGQTFSRASIEEHWRQGCRRQVLLTITCHLHVPFVAALSAACCSGQAHNEARRAPDAQVPCHQCRHW